jgi:hypothetical protein
MKQIARVSSPRYRCSSPPPASAPQMRFLQFFVANIRLHMRRTYAGAADEFLSWCAAAAVPSVGAVQPVYVLTWIEAGTREFAAPSMAPA